MRATSISPARLLAAFALAEALVVSAALCSGCSLVSDIVESVTESSDDTETTDFSEIAEAFSVDALDLEYTDRDQDPSYDEDEATIIELTGTDAEVTGSGVSVDTETGTVTIEAEGTYVVSGTLDDGQLAVNVDDESKVQVVLAGVTIHNEDGPAIYVMQADKCFITLADGTVNTLTDGSSYELEDDSDEPYATLFSRDDLTINGSGTLVVTSSYRHAICSKDDLVITGGTYVIDAVEDGLRGRDCVKILDGTFTITAGGDGIKSNKDTDPERGFITIDGGDITITAGDDGIQAVTYLQVTGGTLSITAEDDAIHTDLELLISGGDLTINAGDDAVHSETVLTVDGGTISVESCYEGLESQEIYINDGEIHIIASDDGVNASVADLSSDTDDTETSADATDDAVADDADDAGLSADAGDGQRGTINRASEMSIAPNGGEGFNEREANGGSPDNSFAEGMDAGTAGSEDCLIQINGGYLYVEADGDGIDSNGSIEITGGTVLVIGPASGDDGALDYDLSATISGGTVLMVGASGMAQNFTSGTQAFAFARVSSNGGTVAVVDEDGTVIASLDTTRSFETVLISSPDLEEDGTYTVLTNATVTDANADGFASSGTASGTEATTVTASTEASDGYGGLGSDGNPLSSGQAGSPF